MSKSFHWFSHLNSSLTTLDRKKSFKVKINVTLNFVLSENFFCSMQSLSMNLKKCKILKFLCFLNCPKEAFWANKHSQNIFLIVKIKTIRPNLTYKCKKKIVWKIKKKKQLAGWLLFHAKSKNSCVFARKNVSFFYSEQKTKKIFFLGSFHFYFWNGAIKFPLMTTKVKNFCFFFLLWSK